MRRDIVRARPGLQRRINNPAGLVNHQFREVEPIPGPDVGIHSTGGTVRRRRCATRTSQGTGRFGSGFYFVSDRTGCAATPTAPGTRSGGVGIDLTGKRRTGRSTESGVRAHDWLINVNLLQHTDDDLDAPIHQFNDPDLQARFAARGSMNCSRGHRPPVGLASTEMLSGPSRAHARTLSAGARGASGTPPRPGDARARLRRIDVRGLDERLDNTGMGSVI